jgi:hypothetical protein
MSSLLIVILLLLVPGPATSAAADASERLSGERQGRNGLHLSVGRSPCIQALLLEASRIGEPGQRGLPPTPVGQWRGALSR